MTVDTLVNIHAGIARATIMFMGIMAVYALFHYFRNRLLGGDFFGIVAVGEVMLVIQVIIGFVAMFAFGAQPARPWVHILYGIFSTLVIPAVYYYTNGNAERQAALTWALVGLFMVGLTLQAGVNATTVL